jgi:hypothetical protein
MKLLRTLSMTLSAAIVIWVVFSWPLSRSITSGIPSSSQSPETRRMVAGDHLQLLYHFWLLADMLGGDTPWFHNLYEFNTGDDTARFSPNAEYVPFSLFYAGGQAMAGRAFGYNLAAFLSVWMSVAFTWFLVRRYAAHGGVAMVATAVAVLLPYRWAMLLGGSPGGFGMAWVPLFFAGLDTAIMERRARGGLLAGVAAMGLSLSDTQGLFFALLAAPFWCLFALVARPGTPPRRAAREFAQLAAALLPALILVGGALLYNHFWHGNLEGSRMAAGRDMSEVALYSPTWNGLFERGLHGKASLIYLGIPVTLISAAGFVAAVLASRREGGSSHFDFAPRDLVSRERGEIRGERCAPSPQSPAPAGRAGRGRDQNANGWREGHFKSRNLWLLVIMVGAVLGVVVLALGTNGPQEGRFLLWARRLVPPYRMLRQPFKVYTLMPVVLPVALTLAMNALLDLVRRPAARSAVLLGIGLVLAADFRTQVRPTICLLDDEQGAYRRVAEDAVRRGETARVLILPLWPGDSALGSLYQYYASMYRIRMVNGYQPAVPRDYFDGVFRRFESVNQGALSDDQLAALTTNGIRYLLLHEDVFPEEVGSFGVCATLDRLFGHNRLEFLRQDGPILAFRVLGPGETRRETALGAASPFYFPARRWEAESCARNGGAILESEWAGAGRFLRLAGTNDWLGTPENLSARLPNLRWLIRARGHGTLHAQPLRGAVPAERQMLTVDGEEWRWLTVPLPDADGRQPDIRAHLNLSLLTGYTDVDLILLAAGEWNALAPGQGVRIPADRFFHAGASDRESGAVRLWRDDHHASGIVFYGPKLPLERGVYDLEVDYESPSAPGVELAWINIRRRESDPLAWNKAIAGGSLKIRFAQEANLPTHLELLMLRGSRMTIHGATLTRVE